MHRLNPGQPLISPALRANVGANGVLPPSAPAFAAPPSRITMRRMKMPIAFAAAAVLAAVSLSAQNGAPKILSVDHKVTVKSIVPAIAGQPAQIYVRERVADGHEESRRRSRGAVRARRRHAGRSRVRCADRRLQLDGVPRQERFRRVLDGHRRLRPLVAAGADERSVQPVGRAAEAVRADADPGAVQGDVSRPAHDDRFRLERHRRRRRSHPQAAQRAEGQHGGVVAWRPARRRLCGAASRQGEPARAAGARVRPRRDRRCARAAEARHRVQHAVTQPSSTRTGIARSAARIRSIRKCAKWCGRR